MNVNRLFCIGKNYAEHVAELAHLGHPAASESSAQSKSASRSAAQAAPAPTSLRDDTVSPPDGECVVFMKPASCIVPAGEPIVLPKTIGSIHHEAELVVLLTGGGRDIAVEEALDCVAGVTLGLDLTARDLQTQLKNKGKPWELAKAFDGAAPLGEFAPYLAQDLQALTFTCHVNGTLRQSGDTAKMLYSVARQIHILSQTWALEPGDAIYTGTPAGVGPLVAGDVVVLQGPGLGRHEWRCE
jgi:2-keto-4-pentenoate hydratase/2-oxohepta-3-ene-1,7-dioic acid hydratase in catechol pathway